MVILVVIMMRIQSLLLLIVNCQVLAVNAHSARPGGYTMLETIALAVIILIVWQRG
jgi:K+ transporter